MENAPVVKEETNLTNLAGPETALAYAQRCSKALMDVVRQCDLAKNFGGKKDHIEYEGWGMIAEFYGCSIGAEEAMPTGDPEGDGTFRGYRAKGYVKRNDDGAILATADSSCSRDEKNWRNKPDYQLMSMAQTRAGSKAARMKFSWIAALAGFSATPAEEMVGEFDSRKPKTKPHQEQDNLPDFEPPPKEQKRSPGRPPKEDKVECEFPDAKTHGQMVAPAFCRTTCSHRDKCAVAQQLGDVEP